MSGKSPKERQQVSDLSFFEKIKDLCYIRRAMPEVITRRERIEGEEWFIVFDEPQQKLYKFKGNAGLIWQRLDGNSSVGKIVEDLFLQGVGEKETLIKDVSRFIAKAGKKGLIKAAVKKFRKEDVADYEDLARRATLP